MHLGLRAAGRLDRGAGRAALGLGTLYHGATGARARRALTDLARFVAGADAGRAGGHGRLENVAAHVGQRGTSRLEHVATHIRLGWAGRDGGLEYILGPVDLRALLTCMTLLLIHAFAGMSGTLTDVAGSLGDIDEAF